MSHGISDADVMRLLDTLSKPELSPEEEQWLAEQLGSTELQERLLALGHAMFPEEFCRACSASLPYYVHLEAMGQDADAAYPQMGTHLRACAECSEQYEELYHVVSEAYADRVPAAASYPRPDLSFLIGDAPAPVWREIETGARRLVFEISLALFQKARELGELKEELQRGLDALWGRALKPVPATVGVRMRGELEEPQAMALQVLDEEQGLLLELSLRKKGKRYAWLVVRPMELESGEPLVKSTVALCDEARKPLEVSSVQENGSVRFTDVHAASYVVRIECGDRRWEIPLNLRGESEEL